MTDKQPDETVAEWPDPDRKTFERRLYEEDPLNSEEERRSEQAFEALLVDYETASEDARYRDRLITQTFYLTFVVGGLFLNGIITLLFQASVDPVVESLWLAIISLISLISFGILLVFVESFQESRESAWARRSEIESYVRCKYGGTLGTNESISGSLSFTSSDGGEESAQEPNEEGESAQGPDEPQFADVSASSVMGCFLRGLLLVTGTLFLISIYRFGCAIEWPL